MFLQKEKGETSYKTRTKHWVPCWFSGVCVCVVHRSTVHLRMFRFFLKGGSLAVETIPWSTMSNVELSGRRCATPCLVLPRAWTYAEAHFCVGDLGEGGLFGMNEDHVLGSCLVELWRCCDFRLWLRHIYIYVYIYMIYIYKYLYTEHIPPKKLTFCRWPTKTRPPEKKSSHRWAIRQLMCSEETKNCQVSQAMTKLYPRFVERSRKSQPTWVRVTWNSPGPKKVTWNSLPGGSIFWVKRVASSQVSAERHLQTFSRTGTDRGGCRRAGPARGSWGGCPGRLPGDIGDDGFEKGGDIISLLKMWDSYAPGTTNIAGQWTILMLFTKKDGGFSMAMSVYQRVISKKWL